MITLRISSGQNTHSLLHKLDIFHHPPNLVGLGWHNPESDDFTAIVEVKGNASDIAKKLWAEMPGASIEVRSWFGWKNIQP